MTCSPPAACRLMLIPPRHSIIHSFANSSEITNIRCCSRLTKFVSPLPALPALAHYSTLPSPHTARYLAYLPTAHILEFSAECAMLCNGAALGFSDPYSMGSSVRSIELNRYQLDLPSRFYRIFQSHPRSHLRPDSRGDLLRKLCVRCLTAL